MNHLPIRFLRKVQKTDTCWLWIGANAGLGYGVIRIDGKNVKAHRFIYELINGKIPEGYVIDHLCHVKPCVNPDHLEAVTQRENIMRGDHANKPYCPKGHKMEGENIMTNKSGHKRCRECNKITSKNNYWLNKEKINA